MLMTINGVSDRVSQTVNSVLTRYALDPAAGLTQVLADGTSTYLYGVGRIAQQQTSMQYFGADGLSSVRQLYNSSGQIIANHRYDPFGNTISQSGVGTSNYGFTGEWTDATGLEYLRARYYTPTQGRFVTRDVWEGDYNAPLTLNGWNYVQANPVNFTDPSGRTRDDYYVFVQGCSPIPTLPVVCENRPEEDMQNYLRFLENKFGFPPATPNDRNFSLGLSNEFTSWMDTHVKFVHAATSDPGGVDTAVHAINRGGGSIFLIGHSVGGTAIIRYLTELKETGGQNPGIAGAVAVDAPLQADLGFPTLPGFFSIRLGFDRFKIGLRWEKLFGDCPPVPNISLPRLELQDRLAGLGRWAQDQGIRLLQVSYADDFVNPTRQVADIPQVVIPTDPNYAGITEIEKKHGYLLSGPGAWPMLEGLFIRGVLR